MHWTHFQWSYLVISDMPENGPNYHFQACRKWPKFATGSEFNASNHQEGPQGWVRWVKTRSIVFESFSENEKWLVIGHFLFYISKNWFAGSSYPLACCVKRGGRSETKRYIQDKLLIILELKTLSNLYFRSRRLHNYNLPKPKKTAPPHQRSLKSNLSRVQKTCQLLHLLSAMMRWLSEWAELLGRWVNSRSSSCATFYPHSAMEAPTHHHQIWLPVNSKWELAPFKPLQTSWLPQFPKRPKSPENLMSMPMNLFSGNSPSQACETRSRLGTAQSNRRRIGSELRWIEKGQDWLLQCKTCMAAYRIVLRRAWDRGKAWDRKGVNLSTKGRVSADEHFCRILLLLALNNDAAHNNPFPLGTWLQKLVILKFKPYHLPSAFRPTTSETETKGCFEKQQKLIRFGDRRLLSGFLRHHPQFLPRTN